MSSLARAARSRAGREVRDQTPRRKRIRLEAAEYAGPDAVCSVTITTLRREVAFSNAALAAECMDVLERRVSETGVTLHTFCFMPDHLHLLLSPSHRTSIVEFVRDFKGETTHVSWRHGLKGSLWQRSFYDHFLRTNEDLERAVKYILENPVRAGLAQDAAAYRFSGWPRGRTG